MYAAQLVLGLVVMVGIVVAVAAAIGLVAKKYFHNMQTDQGRDLRDLEQRFAARLDRLEKLESRVATLETIVTDRRYDLDEQFRDLDKAG